MRYLGTETEDALILTSLPTEAMPVWDPRKLKILMLLVQIGAPQR